MIDYDEEGKIKEVEKEFHRNMDLVEQELLALETKKDNEVSHQESLTKNQEQDIEAGGYPQVMKKMSITEEEPTHQTTL